MMLRFHKEKTKDEKMSEEERRTNPLVKVRVRVRVRVGVTVRVRVRVRVTVRDTVAPRLTSAGVSLPC